jgi:hypothetical protein
MRRRMKRMRIVVAFRTADTHVSSCVAVNAVKQIPCGAAQQR